MRWDYRAAAYEAEPFLLARHQEPERRPLLCRSETFDRRRGSGRTADGSDPVLRYCGSVPHPGSKTPFAPRFGFAYRLNDKTVMRGGYGIFYDSYEGREIDDSADIYPYSIRNSLNPTQDSTLTKFGNNLFPSYATLRRSPSRRLSFIAVIESENPLNPYVQSWTGSVERELGKKHNPGSELHRNPCRSSA